MRRKELQLLIISFIALIIGVLFTLNVSSSIKTGIGFGRDLKLVVTTENKEQLVSFLDEINTKHFETKIRSVNDNKHVITISSADTVEVIDKTMKSTIDDLTIDHIGTFGSATKLANNQSFISLYVLGIVAVIFIYFTMRFKLVGILPAYKISISFVFSLFMMNVFGYPFSESMWYILNLLLIISCVNVHRGLNSKLGQLVFDAFDSKEYLSKSASILVLHTLIAVFIIFSDMFSSPAEGLLIIVFSSFILIFNAIFIVVLNQIKAFIHEDRHHWFRIETSNPIGRFANPKRALGNLVLIGVSLLIVLGVFVPKTSYELPLGQSYTKESVLLIPGRESDAYLEIQAILNSLGLYENQTSYSVSDQAYLWIYFDNNVTQNDLMLSKNVIQSKMNLTSSYYISKAKDFPLQSFDFYFRYIGLTIIAAILLKITYSKRSIGSFITLSILIPVIFTLLSVIYDLKFTEEMILLIIMVPTVLYHLLAEENSKAYLQNPKVFYADFIDEFITNFVIVGAFLAVILIIVPINMGITLSKITFYYFVAIGLGFVLFTYVCSRVSRRKGIEDYDDDISENI